MDRVVCKQPAIPRSPYCARCHPATKAESTKRRIALRTAYDARLDIFRWSGVILVEDDPTDPFQFRWDHYGPGSSGSMEVTCELFASMRAGLSGLEFETLIWALAGHRRGRSFPKVDLDPRGWPERWQPREAAGGNGCVVCGHPTSASYCPRCRRLVGRGGTAVRVAALRKAWRPDKDGFVCHYTGVVLDHGGPWGVAFDERVPGGSTVVAAEWVRWM